MDEMFLGWWMAVGLCWGIDDEIEEVMSEE